MISIITVVNNNTVLKNGLDKSLAQQTFSNFELIKINNEAGEYKSMVEALEQGISQANGEWIYFIHPDIAFLTQYELEKMRHTIEEVENLESNIKIIGVAGATEGRERKLISAIVHGKNQSRVGEWGKNEKSIKYIPVQTIDSCCYAIRKETIEKYGFWKKRKGFHMYIEELCLRVRETGGIAVVIPVNLWHFSEGNSLDYSYYLSVKTVAYKYKSLDYINTTSFQWKNTKLLPLILNFYAVRNYIHHKIFIIKRVQKEETV